MADAIVGVDPGGRYVGVVTCRGKDVTAGAVLTRTTGGELPDAEFVLEVLTEIEAQVERAGADTIALEWLTMPRGRDPEGNKTIMNIAGIVGTGIIIGAVLARWPHAVIIKAGDNGGLPDFAYPEAIRKRVRLGGPTDHARSAYDVAQAGTLFMRARRQGGTG